MRCLLTLCVGLFPIAIPAAADHPPDHHHPAKSATPSAAVPLFDNLGTHHHAITTSSPEAQRYFDR